jgi:3-hydroxyacyl-[acyl-carrier-protein] dehydratase
MRLIGDFYSVTSSLPPAEGSVYGFRIKLNADHFIYKAHFPGHPVTPGVCLIQMVSELASEAEGMRLGIASVKNVKFTDMVSPIDDSELMMIFTSRTYADDGTIKVQAQLVAAADPARVFSKFSVILRKS